MFTERTILIRNANIITGLKGNLPMRKIYLPKIGARIIKSGVAVLLCFLIYQINSHSGILFYMALAALQCMQPDRINESESLVDKPVALMMIIIAPIIRTPT